MGRKKKTINRIKYPESRYNSFEVTRIITRLMKSGKKSTSTKIVYDALSILGNKTGEGELDAFLKVLSNVKPVVEVKSRRVGGATYQIPIEVREARREALAMRWIIQAAKSRNGKSMAQKLGAELVDAFNQTGTAFKKKEDTHKMAEANKAFSHYRW